MCVFQCECKCHWNVARDMGENYVFIPWRRNSTALFCCPSLDLLRRTIFKWIIVQRNLYMYSGTCILIDSLQNIFLYTCQYILFYMNIMTPQIHIEKVHKCRQCRQTTPAIWHVALTLQLCSPGPSMHFIMFSASIYVTWQSFIYLLFSFLRTHL